MTYMYDPQLDDIEYYLQAQAKEAKTSILGGPALPALGHAVSGATGAAISNVITYPLALSITRLQVQRQIRKHSEDGKDDRKDEYKSIPDAFRRIYAEEGGLRAFYEGCAQDTLKSMADSFLFFLAYNFVRRHRLRGQKKLPVHEELAVGMVAGAFSKLFTTPVQQIVTRKQTAAMSGGGAKLGSSMDIARQIRTQKGILGFWSGYSATLVLTLNPALTFLFHETLLRALVRRDKRADPGARVTFLFAAVSKAMASTITYPFSLAKSRAQVSPKAPTADDDEKLVSKNDTARDVEKKAARKVKKDTIFGALLQIAQEEGVPGLYQGLSGEVLKGFFAHGLTMLMKERIHTLIIQMYYVVLKALQRYPSPEELAKLAGGAAVGVKDAVVETATDVKDAVSGAATSAAEKAGELSEEGQKALENGVDSVNELYRKGKEDTADILDDYLSMDPDDDNGWGW